MEKFSQLIEKLNLISEQLDESLSSKLFNINKELVLVKTAQHLGVQGYWVRNTRCWSNCYRQKRASSDKPSQKIWEECHKEYVESINKKESEWEKYAEKEDSLVKVASAKEIYNKEEKFFLNKIANSKNIENDIINVSKQAIDKYEDKYIKTCEKLLDFSYELFTKNKSESALKVANIADSLIKEAQFGGFWSNLKNKALNTLQTNVGDLFKNKNNKQYNPQIKLRWLNSFSQAINTQWQNLTQFSQDKSPAGYSKYNQAMMNFQKLLSSKMTEFGNVVGREYPSADKLFNLISQFVSKKVDSGRGAMLVKQIFPLVETLKGEISLSQKQEVAKEQEKKQEPQKAQEEQQNEGKKESSLDFLKLISQNDEMLGWLNQYLTEYNLVRNAFNLSGFKKQSQFSQLNTGSQFQKKPIPPQYIERIKKLVDKMGKAPQEKLLKIFQKLNLKVVDKPKPEMGGTPAQSPVGTMTGGTPSQSPTRQNSGLGSSQVSNRGSNFIPGNQATMPGNFQYGNNTGK